MKYVFPSLALLSSLAGIVVCVLSSNYTAAVWAGNSAIWCGLYLVNL